jgi:hypothetical protein
MADGCWHCGAPWRCRTCGSFRQRPNGKGCADCHRTRELARKAEEKRLDEMYFPITPAMRSYLKAFDAVLDAERSTGTADAREWASRRKAKAFEGLVADGRRREAA